MKTLITAFLGLLFAVVLTLWVKEDNGYVLIGYGHWTIEGSLALFSLAGTILFLLFYLGMRSLARVWGMPEQLREWNSHRRVARARHSLTLGLVELAEGNWKPAERHLLRYATQSDTPLLNYLAAARAAQLQGEHERRDDYLHLAHESMPAADVAVGLTQAELQLAHQQYEQALATLTHMRTISPKHSYVLRLLKRLYVDLGEWEKLEHLLPELHKSKAVNEQEFRELEIRTYRERLESMGKDPLALEQYWQAMPKPLRRQEVLLKTYIYLLSSLGKGSMLVPLVADALQLEWDPDLVQLYGRTDSGNAAAQLAQAEEWLKGRPQDADLLLALARLCLQNRLWGKARNYLEASIGISARAEAYQELGILLEQMDELDQARACFRAGLGLEHREVVRELPPINRPALNHQLSAGDDVLLPSASEGARTVT